MRNLLKKLATKFYEKAYGDYEKKPLSLPIKDYKTLRACNDQFSKSSSAHYVERLNEEIIQQSPNVEQWEIDQIDEFIKEYTQKYKSPLSKAMN